MAKGDVHFRLDAEEGKAVQAFLKVVDAQKKVESQGRRTARVQRQESKTAQTAVQGVVSSLGTMLASYVSVQQVVRGLTEDVRLMRQEQVKASEATQTFEGSFRKLQFLGDNYRDEGLRGRVTSVAQQYRIDPREVSEAWYTVQSNMPNASRDQQQRLVIELAKARKTQDAQTTMGMLAPGAAKIGNIFPGVGAVEAVNLAMYAIDQASVKDPGEMAKYFPKMLAAGKVGGMDPETASAMGAYLTGQTGTVADAASAMRVINRKVMLQRTKEERAAAAFGVDPLAQTKLLLKKAGATESDDALTRLTKLAALYREGGIQTQQLQEIFGERGIEAGKILFEGWGGFQEMRQRFYEQTPSNVNVQWRKFRASMAQDPTLRAMETAERIDVQNQVARQSPAAVRYEAARRYIERIRASKRFDQRWEGDLRNWFGELFTGPDAEDMLSNYGYSPEEVEQILSPEGPRAPVNLSPQMEMVTSLRGGRVPGVVPGLGEAAADLKAAARELREAAAGGPQFNDPHGEAN